MKKVMYLAVLVCFTAMACKSRKNAVPQSSTSFPAEDVQYDAYRNKLPGTRVDRVEKGIKVTFDSEILFPTNSSYLTDAAKENIKNLVEVVKKQGEVNIVIDGHTDKTGTSEYNKWLSDKRAASVKTFAVSLGLPEASIATAGYGDIKPVADNRTPEGRAKNRRVEVTITPVR